MISNTSVRASDESNSVVPEHLNV